MPGHPAPWARGGPASAGPDDVAPAHDALLPPGRSQLDALREGPEEYGGSCDCGVVVDVDPAVVPAPGDQAAEGPSSR